MSQAPKNNAENLSGQMIRSHLCSSLVSNLLHQSFLLLLLVSFFPDWHQVVQPEQIVLAEDRGDVIHHLPEAHQSQNLPR